MFTLGIVKWRYSNNVESGYTLIPSATDRDIQQDFLQLATQLKDFDVTINDHLKNRLHGYLKERFHMVQKQQLRLIYKYMSQIEPLLKLLADTSKNPSLNQTVRNEVQLALNEITNELTENLEDLKIKARFIHDLKKRNFEYYNVVDDHFNRIDNEQTVERILKKNNPNCHILCSNDTLNNNNPSKLDELLRQLTNQKIRRVYADFSYCSYKLPDMMILSSSSSSSSKNISKPLPLPDHEVINILLLGETGVGKSTFINAFVNYLTFDTLKQAETNEPIALIPTSFLMTTGDNFDEYLIKFGDFNRSNNEDFSHPGQSVTQHCKLHRFDLRRDIGKKLCIIDTPGFGDTRGLNQDDINMKHILKYVNNLTHLNAICFLLKPNESRLNIFFRTCLTQLLDLFGSNIRQNIIFGFTNARSTSYTPGNTAPILRAMLDSLSINDIPFKKENTFCFDSESFRYLVALQNGIEFNEEDKYEYEISWKTSVSESNRLLNYVSTQLNIYSLDKQLQSKKHAQIEIVQMIRPILETMRNILRNRILKKLPSSTKFIKLCPKSIHQPITFCTSCKRDPFLLGQFWILPDDPHQIHDKCLICGCTTNQHISVDYILSYEIINDLSSIQLNEMNDDILNQLCLTSVEFSYFLINIARSTKEDLFLGGLIRMIEEERQICTTIKDESNHLNFELLKELEILKQNYEQQMQKISTISKHQDLQSIYKRMQTIYDIPFIHEQMIVIKEKRTIPIQKEHEDSETSTKINSS